MRKSSLLVSSRHLGTYLAAAALFAAGCNADWDAPAEDASTDAGPADTGVPDVTTSTGMDGGEDASSANDGGRADAGASDAQTDAVVVPALEGGVSAGFCGSITKGMSTLCTDFENNKLVAPNGEGFDWLAAYNNPGPTLVDEGKADGKRALKSTLSGSNTDEASMVAWSVEYAARTLTAAFDFLPSLQLPVNPGALVTWYKVQQNVELKSPADGGGDTVYYPAVALSTRHNGTFLTIQNTNGSAEPTYDEYLVSAPFPSGWFRVEVEIATGTKGSVTVKYNGTVVLLLKELWVLGNPGQTYHEVGLTSQAAAAPCSALYDNVIVDAKL